MDKASINQMTQRRAAIFDTETAVVRMQSEDGRKKRNDTSSNKKRSTSPPRDSNKFSLETLAMTFFSVLFIWAVFFCIEVTHSRSPSQQLKETKLDFAAVKRKPLKDYLDDRLPQEDVRQQISQERPQQGSPRRIVTSNINVGALPINLRQPSGNLENNPPRRRALGLGKIVLTHDVSPLHKKSQLQPPKTHPQVSKKRRYNAKVLTAYLESPATLQEDVKPLPPRKTSKAMLQAVEFPQVQQCSTLLSDFGKHVVDEFPSGDPFLPWLHDFFPNPDGTRLVFVGQNRRNCLTGDGMYAVMKHWKPQIALFQPVPLLANDHNGVDEPSFRLADSLEKNVTAKETRFLCRFHNATNHSAITLSVFPFNYEFVSWRKNRKMMEEQEGINKDALNQSPFWVSQLLFSCPIPKQFQALVKQANDEPSLWVDVIPIRTPARSDKVLLTKEMTGNTIWKKNSKSLFRLDVAYGKNHTLPSIEDSGRWANLPICSSPPQQARGQRSTSNHRQPQQQSKSLPKPHRLVACTWASVSYQRRGNAVTVRDSHARLREWILFHRLVGFDHLYVYDNTPVSNNTQEEGLESVTKEFPKEFVTHVRWPCKVCSNNRPMNKNPGDRSSQYAAEASCRERFGPFTEWMSFIDTDEYLVPMKHETWSELLDDMESKNIHVLKMRSSRGLPRHDLMQSLADQGSCEIPVKRSAAIRKLQPQSCQEPNPNETFLKVYNCDYIKPPRPDRFARAMKQIYRPSYVLSHFVHYSTITGDVARYQKDQANATADDTLWDWKEAGADKEIFLDELEQGSLIHARSVLPHETMYRSDMCRSNSKHKCPLGFVCPSSTEWVDDKERPGQLNPFVDRRGRYCNCWINEQVENVFVPKLEAELKNHHKAVMG